MSALDDLAGWMDRVPELRRAEQRRRERAVAQLRLLGVEAVLRSDGAILVPASGYEVLRRLATYPNPTPGPDRVLGIPIYKAADWTFDPTSVALARFVAVLLRPFGRLVRWLTRRGRA